ncbi:MAG: PAAR domain-containing protein [Duganella sp.]
MAGALIRLGDKTSHGGAVLSASPVSESGGIAVARVGDRVSCPRPGHVNCVIVSGDATMIVDGQPVARHGDKVSCGATLIASQQATIDQI